MPRSLPPVAFRSLAPCLAVLTSLAWHAPASADCYSRKPELIWSYPSDGATGIPTNAKLFILSTVRTWAVQLNGQELAPQELPRAYQYELPLSPNTAYTLTVLLHDSDAAELADGGVALVPVELAFETGAGPQAETAPDVELVRISSTERFSAECQKVVDAQDCYDEGQDTHVVAEVEGKALVYILSSRRAGDPDSSFRNVFWPASCGSPSRFTIAGNDECHTVRAVNEIGQVTSTEELCAKIGTAPWEEADGDLGAADAGAPPAQDGSDKPNAKPASSDGCALSTGRSSMAGGAMLALVLGALLGRLRRVRRY